MESIRLLWNSSYIHISPGPLTKFIPTKINFKKGWTSTTGDYAGLQVILTGSEGRMGAWFPLEERHLPPVPNGNCLDIHARHVHRVPAEGLWASERVLARMNPMCRSAGTSVPSLAISVPPSIDLAPLRSLLF